MEDKLFSIQDAANYLGGISIWTVRAWLSQGRMNRSKIGARTMIRQSELNKVIRDGLGAPLILSADEVKGPR
jgi:excisionase family DNA binding protein